MLQKLITSESSCYDHYALGVKTTKQKKFLPSLYSSQHNDSKAMYLSNYKTTFCYFHFHSKIMIVLYSRMKNTLKYLQYSLRLIQSYFKRQSSLHFHYFYYHAQNLCSSVFLELSLCFLRCTSLCQNIFQM
jgi:hypothetical protein